MLEHKVNNNIYKLLQTDDRHYTLSKNDVSLLKIRGNKDNEPILKDIDKYIDGKITKYENTHSNQTLEEIKEMQSVLQSFQGKLVNEHEHKESVLGKFIETFLSKVHQRYEKAFVSVDDCKYNTNFNPDESGNKVSIEQNMRLPEVNQGVIKVAYNEVEASILTPTTHQEENQKLEDEKIVQDEPLDRARSNESFIISDKMSLEEKKKVEKGKFQLNSDIMQNQNPFSKLPANDVGSLNNYTSKHLHTAGLNKSTPQLR